VYFCPYFLYFLIDLGEFWYRSLVISLSHYEFMKISAVKAMMCLGNKENFTHVYYTDLVTILCRILASNSIKQFQLCENRCSENHTSLTRINEILPIFYTSFI